MRALTGEPGGSLPGLDGYRRAVAAGAARTPGVGELPGEAHRLPARARRGLLVTRPAIAPALAADAALSARPLLSLSHAVFALSIEAMAAPLAAYHPELARHWGDAYASEALAEMNRLLEGAGTPRRVYQAPVSYRILPRVLGQAHRAAAAMEGAAERSLASAELEPVALPPAGGRPPLVLETGASWDGSSSAALNTLSASWADLCTLADRHTTQLLRETAALGQGDGGRPAAGNGARGDGAAAPDLSTLAALGTLQGDIGERARQAAARTFLPPSEAGAREPSQDVSTPVVLAYERQSEAAGALVRALAVLGLAACQSLSLSRREVAPRLGELRALVASHARGPAPATGEAWPGLPGLAGRLARSSVDPLAAELGALVERGAERGESEAAGQSRGGER